MFMLSASIETFIAKIPNLLKRSSFFSNNYQFQYGNRLIMLKAWYIILLRKTTRSRKLLIFSYTQSQSDKINGGTRNHCPGGRS